MQIRAGFEIAYDCKQPTPMLLALSVHPSRLPDIAGPHRITFDPPVEATNYHDGFGNICTRIVAPPGQLTVSTNFVIRDSGTPDPAVPSAVQHPVAELPATRWSTCSAAAIATPTGCRTRRGRCSAAHRRIGRGCRRSAAMRMTASPSATNTPTRPGRPGAGIPGNVASAAIAPISPSPCAAA